MTAPTPERRVGEAETALVFALEELKRWPNLPGIPFYCYDPEGGKTALRHEQVQNVFDALHAYAITVWPRAQEAMRAYCAQDALRAEVARLTAEVERLREENHRITEEAECLHARDAEFARLHIEAQRLHDAWGVATLAANAAHEALCRFQIEAAQLVRDAIAEVENTERGWHAHGTEFDPEWPAEYMESGNLQALRARLAALSLPTPAPEATE